MADANNAVRLDFTGSGKIGGGFQWPDMGHWSTDQPAFWSLVILALAIIGLVAIFKSLR